MEDTEDRNGKCHQGSCLPTKPDAKVEKHGGKLARNQVRQLKRPKNRAHALRNEQFTPGFASSFAQVLAPGFAPHNPGLAHRFAAGFTAGFAQVVWASTASKAPGQ